MERFYQDFKENVAKQYSDCKAYRLLCDSAGFNPDFDMKCEEDISKVPFIATTVFKKSAQLFQQLLRVPVGSIDKWTISSSTSGDPSIVGRKKTDILKMKELIDNSNKDITVQDCVFYPEPEVMKNYRSQLIYGKATESYIGNILDIYDFKGNTIFLVKPDGNDLTVDLNEFKDFLLKYDGKEEHISIKGSTLLLYDAVEKLKETMQPINLGENALIYTGGGGWDGKKGTVSIGQALKRQVFVETLSSFLSIPEDNFYDGYSFTENSFPITGHYSKEDKDYLFHIPHWGKVIIRDIKTLEPLYEPGDRGFIEMLNAYGTSSFAGAAILVDDIGEIVSIDKCPKCGYKGMTIKILGRVKGSEAKGCGATLNVKGDSKQ